MAQDDLMQNLVPCPGCTGGVHPRASECPHCGYRAEVSRYHNVLSGLGVISSILLGFTLGGLVALVTEDTISRTLDVKVLEATLTQLIAGFWILSTILLLVVLVTSEIARRQDLAECLMVLSDNERDRMERLCVRLLSIFTGALAFMAIGIVILSFHFSVHHGGGALIAAILATMLVARLLR